MTSLTVSGPDVDLTLRGYGVGAALSRALTEAEEGGRDDASYYVRDGDGAVVGRVDRVLGQTFVRTGRDLDREVGGASDAPPTRRPGSSRRRTKEEPEVPEQKTKAKRSTAKKASRSSRSSVPAAQEKAAAPPESEAPAVAETLAADAAGESLYETLLSRVRAVVDGLEAKPNKSNTYTRLLAGGRAFAYVFPPRKGGVALKIPKQLLAVERELPAGHGFKATGWGLTRTLKDPADAAIVAKSLGVAAKAVAAK